MEIYQDIWDFLFFISDLSSKFQKLEVVEPTDDDKEPGKNHVLNIFLVFTCWKIQIVASLRCQMYVVKYGTKVFDKIRLILWCRCI